MLALSSSSYRQIVRASALYDLLLTAPFATPWSFSLMHTQLTTINQQLGGSPLPAFAAFHVLIACLFGSIVTVWSVLRLSDPQQRFGRFDGIARFMFSTWMAWALSVTGAPMLWLFLIPELTWGIIQWLPVAQPPEATAFPLQ